MSCAVQLLALVTSALLLPFLLASHGWAAPCCRGEMLSEVLVERARRRGRSGGGCTTVVLILGGSWPRGRPSPGPLPSDREAK
jgi:hypothetical protein